MAHEKNEMGYGSSRCTCMCSGRGGAFAAYPAKQITVLQGFKPGGGSDTLAQLTQPYLEKAIGQSFINQYIPGATGAIAWTQLAKTTKKDGYTISITNTPMLQTNYIMNPEITYNITELELLRMWLQTRVSLLLVKTALTRPCRIS